MSQLLYQANPSVWRTHPFGTLIAWLLVLGGGFVVATGQIPYLTPLLYQLLPGLQLPAWFDPRHLGIALIAIGVLRLLSWWFAAKFDQLEIHEREIVWTHGFLSKNYTETNMASIRTVRVHQSLLQRILNAGDLVIYTTGDEPELSIKGLPRPAEIREHIKRQSSGEA
ncbi:PH domain-containing protein [Thiohalocapsa marina]|uniref:PH domain-containing protein n=1 Tax=Thiohalocapsa marina TaxID=424902 RepID=A0A5M8FQ30_9GAMM|nr:PH domain-containing protein [Thiohalocapsa marina]KAA6185816.1 PH domain-containing protein [Thiohalocapsa marina]